MLGFVSPPVNCHNQKFSRDVLNIVLSFCPQRFLEKENVPNVKRFTSFGSAILVCRLWYHSVDRTLHLVGKTFYFLPNTEEVSANQFLHGSTTRSVSAIEAHVDWLPFLNSYIWESQPVTIPTCLFPKLQGLKCVRGLRLTEKSLDSVILLLQSCSETLESLTLEFHPRVLIDGGALNQSIAGCTKLRCLRLLLRQSKESEEVMQTTFARLPLIQLELINCVTDTLFNCNDVSGSRSLEKIALTQTALSTEEFQACEFGHLPHLTHLTLKNEAYLMPWLKLDSVSSLATSQTLENLYMENARNLTNNGITGLENIPTLKVVSFIRNERLNNVNSLSLSRSITTLNLSCCPVTNEGICELHHIPTLESLNLDSTRVSVLSSLSQCISLKTLIATRLPGVFDESLLGLHELPCLTYLSLGGCSSVRSVHNLSQCPRLRKLDLTRTAITSLGIQNLRNVQTLEDVVFASCLFLTSIESLQFCSQLQRVVCTGSKVQKVIGNFPNLHTLLMDECKDLTTLCTTSILSALKHFTLTDARCMTTAEFDAIAVCMPNIEILRMTGCGGIENYAGLAACTKLRILELSDSNNKLLDSFGFCVGSLDSLTCLEMMLCPALNTASLKTLLGPSFVMSISITCIDFSQSMNVNNDCLSLLGNMVPNLQVLNVTGCSQISSVRGLSPVKHNLQTLCICSTAFNGDGLELGFPPLEVLQSSDCARITDDSILIYVLCCINVRKLDISNTQVTKESIQRVVTSLARLEDLFLVGCPDAISVLKCFEACQTLRHVWVDRDVVEDFHNMSEDKPDVEHLLVGYS
eukprot:PhF_6_TR29084/c0_g1_i2/m.42405